MPHGKGIYEWSNGNKYEGDFRNDAMYGQGTFTPADGSYKLTGNWKNGVPHGKGIKIQSDGGKYEGNFLNNKRDGFGVAHYSNGDTYEGNWIADKKEGVGKLSIPKNT